MVVVYCSPPPGRSPGSDINANDDDAIDPQAWISDRRQDTLDGRQSFVRPTPPGRRLPVSVAFPRLPYGLILPLTEMPTTKTQHGKE